jgi:hypothetical protein
VEEIKYFSYLPIQRSNCSVGKGNKQYFNLGLSNGLSWLLKTALSIVFGLGKKHKGKMKIDFDFRNHSIPETRAPIIVGTYGFSFCKCNGMNTRGFQRWAPVGYPQRKQFTPVYFTL